VDQIEQPTPQLRGMAEMLKNISYTKAKESAEESKSP
jgi:hypothetical protein